MLHRRNVKADDILITVLLAARIACGSVCKDLEV
jgi:hypothetical protein